MHLDCAWEILIVICRNMFTPMCRWQWAKLDTKLWLIPEKWWLNYTVAIWGTMCDRSRNKYKELSSGDDIWYKLVGGNVSQKVYVIDMPILLVIVKPRC